MTRRRFVARPDGNVYVDIRRPMVVTPAEAKLLAGEAHRAAREAEWLRAHADGSNVWTAQPMPTSTHVVVTHRGIVRVFRPTKIRRSYSCTSCAGRIKSGETAYVEHNARPNRSQFDHNPSWRHVRLCEACARPELRGRALIERSKLAGVGIER